MSEAPERIWAEPGLPGYLDEPNALYTVEYVRADHIKKLETKLKELEEQLEFVHSLEDWGGEGE